MLEITVIYNFNLQGKNYFQDWFANVKLISSKQDGFISINAEIQEDDSNHELFIITAVLCFTTIQKFEQWISTDTHNKLAEKIRPYFLKPPVVTRNLKLSDKIKLGKTDIEIPKQGLGCMSMSEGYGEKLSKEQVTVMVKLAYENGVNFFDTADIYDFGENEKLVGYAIQQLMMEGISRKNIVIASKCGIVRDKNDVTKHGIDNSYAYVKSSCEASLERLGKSVGFIDLYYIHRIANKGSNIEEAMRAMAELLHKKKIRAVGLSEATADVIEKANQALMHYTKGMHQLAALQSEYSLLNRRIEQNNVLNTCKELGITIVAYSPLCRALLTGEILNTEQFVENDFRSFLPRFQKENLAKNNRIVEQIAHLAKQKNCTAAQISLAWLMNKLNVVPIPGTTKTAHFLANVAATSLHLSEKEMQLLNALDQAHGAPYPESLMKVFEMEN